MPILNDVSYYDFKIVPTLLVDTTAQPFQGFVITFAYSDGSGSERIESRSNDPDTVREAVGKAIDAHKAIIGGLG